MKELIDSFYDDLQRNNLESKKFIDGLYKLKEELKEKKYVYKSEDPYVRDHLVANVPVVLGVTHISIAINEVIDGGADIAEFRNVTFTEPIGLEFGTSTTIKFEKSKKGDRTVFSSVYQKERSEWKKSASGVIVEDPDTTQRTLTIDEKSIRYTNDADSLFDVDNFVIFGPSHKIINQIGTIGDKSVIEIELKNDLLMERNLYKVHPLMVSSSFIGVLPLLIKKNIKDSFLPIGIKNVRFFRVSEPLEKCRAIITLSKISYEMVLFDADYVDSDDKVILELKGCSMKKIHQKKNDSSAASHSVKKKEVVKKKSRNTSDILSKYISELIEKISGKIIDPINYKTNLMDFGIESEQLISIVELLEKELKIELNPTVLFEYPSISELSEYIGNEFQDALNEFNMEHDHPSEEVQTSKKIINKTDAKKSKSSSKKDENPICGYISELIELISGIKIEKKNYKTNLMDFGIESEQLIKVVEELEKKFEIELNPIVLFEYPSIHEFAEYIKNEFSDVYQKYSSNNDAVEESLLEMEDACDGTVTFDDLMNTDYSKTDFDGDLSRHEPMAIVGISTVLPDSDNIDEFWNNLITRKDMIKEVPKDHFDIAQWYSPDKNKKNMTYSKWGTFIKGVDEFDAEFFSVSPREAEWMDPQIRLMLQSVYNAVEDSGFINSFRHSNTGVFVGACFHDYEDKIAAMNIAVGPYLGTGNASTVISNRVSFFFDLKGPSLTLDTACSSSLVALNQACYAIQRNECEMAIVSGINLLLDSAHYRYFSSLGALSPTGRCNSFDKKADGYVPGECIASLVIKPLRKAKADNDKIYGIVKGSVVLHGGYTPSLTAPSVEGEKNLLLRAWKNADVDPRTISYVECHGTGTKLGDPIEIESLTNAFREFTSDTSFCAAGSVKANVGHTEGAAGILGVIKVLLQFKHKTIPRLPFFEELNPYIKLNKSAIYFNDDTIKWETDGYPRRAGVSAFGFSGAYAHLVLEEFNDERNEERKFMPTRYAIPLSANNEILLPEMTKRLRKYLSENTDTEFKDIVYTLQCCREAMKYRLIFIAENREELISKLDNYISTGRLTDFDGTSADSELGEVVSEWMNGETIEWEKLNDLADCRVANIPVYPFLKTKYWIHEEYSDTGSCKKIHPLVHENVSTIDSQNYHTVFNGNEFCLRGHIVQGKPVLPGVIYLEMIRFALKDALRDYISDTDVISMRDVVWVRPMVHSGSDIDVYISLTHIQDSEFRFKVVSLNDGEKIEHCQGNCSVAEKKSDKKIDIVEYVNKCNLRKITGEYCYNKISEIGINYSKEFTGISEIYNSKDSIMVKLDIDTEIFDNHDAYILNPGILDSAIQSAIALSEEGQKEILTIPFSLKEINAYGKCTGDMWARVEYSPDAAPIEDGFTYNIEIYDADGILVLDFKDLCTRKVELNKNAEDEVFYLRKTLTEVGSDENIKNDVFYEYKRIIMCLADEEKAAVSNKIEFIKYKTDSSSLMCDIYEKLKNAANEKCFIQFIADSSYHAVAEGIHAMLKVFKNEFRDFSYQMIEYDDTANDLSSLADRGTLYPFYYLNYSNSVLKHEIWSEFNTETDVEFKYRDNGVYVITGGSGKIAYLTAQHIAKKAKNPVIILIGRREQDKKMSDRISCLKSIGCVCRYMSADISDKSSVKNVFENIMRSYGKINGVFHLAGITRDNLIRNKDRTEFESVIKPKINGIINIDEAIKDADIDMFVAFSSISPIIGAIGQADYAAGNGFMDGFIEQRNCLSDKGQRCGKSISINWTLWKNGGMSLNEDNQKTMTYMYGLEMLENEDGMNALDNCLINAYKNILVVSGKEQQVDNKFIHIINNKLIFESEKNDSNSKDQLNETTIKWVVQLIHKITKIPVEGFNVKENFGQLGLDSIAMTEFANEISAQLGISISPALFFEYSTVTKLSAFLCNEYRRNLSSVIDIENVSEANSEEIHQKKSITDLKNLKAAFVMEEKKTDECRDIAIIGMSCAFPMADNEEEYWDNLINGRNCISTVPETRWNWREIYGDPMKEINKTKVNAAGFINDIDKFDPLFFGITPKEATYMDPTHRIMMMHIWKAIENAGYSAESLRGSRTGIFTAVASSGYSELYKKADAPIEAYSATSMASSVCPNRMSYLLDLHGPSEPYETACSSSLVALHRAIQCIYDGDCSMALVGGINLFVDPGLFISFDKAGMLSGDARCKAFSKGANGYARGEGVGVIVVKPLKDAERDNDNIIAVIKSAAVNHGGNANTFTSPNPEAQKNVIVSAYDKAGVPASTISYIETHGTGTPIGDPVEINALKNAFCKDPECGSEKICGLGSVKTNIGHLELAAGMASLIKVILQLKNKTLAPTINFTEVNPYIDIESSPFYLVHNKKKWENRKDKYGNDIPLRAGVSGFSFGGVNAHIVLEEYNKRPESSADKKDTHIFVFSAKTKSALRRRIADTLEFLKKNNDININDFEKTLAFSRDSMKIKTVFAAETLSELIELLEKAVISDTIEGIYKKCLSMELSCEYELSEWIKGSSIDFTRIVGDRSYHKIVIPTYPFDKKSYWITNAFSNDNNKNEIINEPKNRNNTNISNYIVKPCWEKINFSSDSKCLKRQTIIIAVDKNTAVKIANRFESCTYYSLEEFCNYFDFSSVGNSALNIVAYLDNEWNVNSSYSKIVSAQDGCLYRLFNIFRKMILSRLNQNDISWTIITNRSIGVLNNDEVNPVNAGVFGITGCISKECPNWKIRVIDTDTFDYSYGIFDCLPYQEHDIIAVREGEYYIRKLKEISAEYNVSNAYKQNGIYVIIGGMGGIGKVYAKYLRDNYNATIVFIGRSEFNNDMRNYLEELNGADGRSMYIRSDASDYNDIRKAFRKIFGEYDTIDGVIHSALVLNDKLIFSMTEDDFKKTAVSKIDVTVNIAKIINEYDIEMFTCFSSISSFIKGAGQSNYSSGCCFQESFCKYFSISVNCSVNVVNWGYWGEIGIVANEEYKNAMKNVGIYSVSISDAMEFLEYIISSEHDQLIYIRADDKFISSFVSYRNDSVIEDTTAEITAESSASDENAFDISDILSIINKKVDNINQNEVSKKVKSFISEILVIDETDVDLYGFSEEMFGDYLKLNSFVCLINSEFNTELTVDDVYMKNISEIIQMIQG